MSAKTSGCKWSIAFAECKYVCAPIDQELDHFNVTLHAGNVQRRITEVPCFIYVNASIDENFGRRKIAPSNNTMKSVIAITAACIHIRKIGFGEVARFAQPGKNLFYLIIHTQKNPRTSDYRVVADWTRTKVSTTNLPGSEPQALCLDQEQPRNCW
jgi:hypothetical protein